MMKKNNNSTVEKNNKKIVALALALVLLIGGSYAWLQITLNGTKTARIEAGTLAVDLVDETEGINIGAAYPMTDENGRNPETNPTSYKFILENTGTVASLYTVYLDKQAIDTSAAFDMPLNLVKCHITKKVMKKVGERDSVEQIEAESGDDTKQDEYTTTTTLEDIKGSSDAEVILDSSAKHESTPLGKDEYALYEIRLWISDEAKTTDLNKSQEDGTKKSAEYSGKLRIEATQTGIEEDEAYSE